MAENLPLTIVLPLYNVERFIGRCLESIYSQEDAGRIEVILVDDGSPDRSAEVAERWLTVRGVTNWRLIHQENRGLGGARNTGLRNASGEWIWFVDSDDEIAPGALNAILSNLNDRDDAISFDYVKVGCNEEQQLKSNLIPVSHCAGVSFVRFNRSGAVWKNVYRVGFLRDWKICFREHFLHEDGEFSMRFLALANSVSQIPRVIYRYYISNGESITNNLGIRNFRDLFSYVDTYGREKSERSLTPEQETVLQQFAGNGAYYAYSHVNPNAQEVWQQYKSLVLAKRRQIIRATNRLPLKQRLLHVVMTYVLSRRFYKWYFKK